MHVNNRDKERISCMLKSWRINESHGKTTQQQGVCLAKGKADVYTAMKDIQILYTDAISSVQHI